MFELMAAEVASAAVELEQGTSSGYYVFSEIKEGYGRVCQVTICTMGCMPKVQVQWGMYKLALVGTQTECYSRGSKPLEARTCLNSHMNGCQLQHRKK